jgi:hypothetical protein
MSIQNTPEVDKYGLMKTGEYTSVNPNFQAPINPRVAAINAQITSSPLAALEISQASSAFNTNQPITSSSLSNTTNPITLPQTTSSTSQTAGSSVKGLTEGLNTGIQGMISAEDAKIATAQKAVETSTTKSQSLIDKWMGKGQAQVSAETAAGIPEKTQALTDINNEYNTKALEYKRMIEDVGKSGIPLNSAQYRAQVASIEKQSNRELADIGIKQAVAQNNLSAAQQLVDRKIDLEYGDLKDIIGYQQQFLQMNREDLTKAEQNAFNLKIEENKQTYETGKSIGEFAKTVAANGADAGTISRVAGAKTMQEAVTAAGQYAGKTETQVIDVNGTKQLIDSRTGKVIKTYGGEPVNVTGLTTEQANDPFIQSMLKTKGGKNLTDTPLQQINKGLTVLGQLGSLQTNINNTKTGPILGAFKGANPWDTNAQTIKAQLNAVVPNLARGIYGEVGVLTDNDIKTYSSTIGNLKSTNDVNNAIMYITLDLIGKSIKNTLSVQAAGGRDVSGFVEIYSEMEKQKNSILSSLPQAENTASNNPFLQVLGGNSNQSANIWNPSTGIFNIPTN